MIIKVTSKNCLIIFISVVLFYGKSTAYSSPSCGDVRGYNPSSLGSLENEPPVREARFEQIKLYLINRQFDNAITYIQQIIDFYTTEPKVLIVGYFRLYEALGSAGLIEPLEEKQLYYYNRALKALSECEKLILAQSINEQETLYKDILETTIPVAYVLIYERRGYLKRQILEKFESKDKETTSTLQADTGEADLRKALEIARSLIFQKPNSPASIYVLNSFDWLLRNLYESSEYENQLQTLINKFSGTPLEVRFRENLARHYFRNVYQSTKDLFRAIDSLIERHGKTPAVETLLSEYKRRIVEDLFKKYELTQSSENDDESTSPSVTGKKYNEFKFKSLGCTCDKPSPATKEIVPTKGCSCGSPTLSHIKSSDTITTKPQCCGSKP